MQFSTQRKRITEKLKQPQTPNLNQNQTPHTQLKILAFSSINLHGFLGICLIVPTQTLLLIHFWHITLCVTDTLPPNYIPGNTDSCIDNTKWILLSPVLACLSRWKKKKHLHFAYSTEGENSIEKVSLSRRLSGNVLKRT